MPRVSYYIEQQPQAIIPLLNNLRHIITTTLPEAEESIKWKIPFYSAKGLLCYLNPVKNNTVALGFCQGSQLASHPEVLTGDGKQVRHLLLTPADPIPEQTIRTLLHEAYLLNEQLQQARQHVV